MIYLGMFDTQNDVDAAIDEKSLLKPYVAHVDEGGGYVDWNSSNGHDYTKDYLTLKVISGGTINYAIPRVKAQLSVTTYTGKSTSSLVECGTTYTTMSHAEASPFFYPVPLRNYGFSYRKNKGSWVTIYGSEAYPNGITRTISLVPGDTIQLSATGNVYGNVNFRGRTTEQQGTGGTAFNKWYWKKVSAITLTNQVHISKPSFSSGLIFEAEGNFMSLATSNFSAVTTVSSDAVSGYTQIFQGTRITNAKNLKLPATTLAEYCYQDMFYGCTGLTSAPELPATTLVNRCYGNMFYNCTNLNSVKALFTTTPSTTYTQNWLQGVSSTGTFYKNPSATWDSSITPGASTVPANWTIENAS